MSNDVNLDEVIDGGFDDRGGFSSSKTRRIAGLKAFIFILLLFVLGLVAFVIIQALREKNEEPAAGDMGASEVSVPSYRFPNAPPAAEEPEPSAPVAIEPITPPEAPQATPEPSWSLPEEETTEEEELTPEQRTMARRLSGFSSTPGGSAQQVSSSGGGGQGLLGGMAGGAGDAGNAFTDRLNSGSPRRIQASILENPTLTIPAGTAIPCGTVSELDTTVPGQVSCQVSRPVYGADNKVRLIDPGAHVTGLVEGGISRGQARVFVAWQRARNPDHVTIQLDSAGAGPLGAAGVGGQVNNYFWERFGSAMAVSVFGDASEAAFSHLAASSSSSDTTINLDNTSDTVDQLAQEVLRANMDIPPTLYTPQGQPVIIYVSHDLDFSDVYRLEVK
ncbi:TrbI/VirB10 family protein [Halomonas sp. 3A7M]|uniref:TrbI/VirB10 family protein n=1 Tax=Halomonas sp. 3A7M TaxID=2742616 RepID=UPI0018683D43|nr:TrbI/VirB10 family protein [Halomonas sp. 3A7M]